MPQFIGAVTLVVEDYEKAKTFYTRCLGFEVVQDTSLGEGKRWIVLAPPGSRETRLLLAKAEGAEQSRRVGDQTGGRVGFFLHTDDFWRDHARMVEYDVRFLETPRTEPYGIVAVFEDLYGNRWDLLQPQSI